MTELEALRRVAEAARVLAHTGETHPWYVDRHADLLVALQDFDLCVATLPAPAAAPQPTPDRPQALEALYAVVRDYDRATGQDVRWSDVTAALAAVDDSPAPATEPEREVVEVVEVVASVHRDRSGLLWVHHSEQHNDGTWSIWASGAIATIRARVPLPRVPEVVGEVG